MLISNLMRVAGAWAGFDLDWLERRILARHRRRTARLHVVWGAWVVAEPWAAIRRYLASPRWRDPRPS
jgi:hypothetical protein